MSRKIEKKLRKAADKEHQEILDSNKPFLNEVLLPRHEEKRQEMIIAKKSRRSKYARYGLFAAPVVALLIVCLTVFFIFSPEPENGYLGPFDTTPSDLQTINQNLIETQLSGEFGSIVLSSDTKTSKVMSFTICHEVTKDDAIIESNIELIIERSLTFDFEKAEYQNRLSFLGYEIKFNKSIPAQNTYDDMPVFEFNITAYFDTGKERFYINYYEISVNEDSYFSEYLAALIQSKNKIIGDIINE